MFPWVYEFRWTPYHLVFLGIFFSVVAVISTTIAVAVIRAYRDFGHGKVDAIQWKAAFEDLPAAARVCRHELTGEVAQRHCDHDFNCGTCAMHPVFLAKYNPERLSTQLQNFSGFQFGFDRMYHRGHSWAKKEADGTFTIGLDDFGIRLIGTPDSVALPQVGTRLTANGTGWHMKKMNATLRILAPIDGEVVEQGGPDKGWYLKLRTDDSEPNTHHLLRGSEIGPWILREMDRLQLSMAADSVGPCLADGGELAPEMWKQHPHINWAGVWGEMFLEA